MEKKNAAAAVTSASASDVAVVASKVAASASDVAAVASKVVPAFDVAAGGSADAGRGKTPLDWDAYEEDEYIRPENSFDTSLVDPLAEVTKEQSSDLESVDTKARQVLRRLQSGQYDAYFANDIYRCPFCARRFGTTDFNCIVTHAENVSSCNPKVGETVNVNALYAKHRAFGIHLRKLQQVAIAEDRMPPIKPKLPKIKEQGSKKWRKRQREESGAWRW